VDVPAHAWGLRPLKARGLSYCSEENGVIDNTPESLQLLDALMKEFATIFPDPVMHFGADEACKHNECPGNCTQEGVHAVEEHMQTTLKSLGKTPMGWNDVFSDPKGGEPNAALPGTLIQNWGQQAPTTFASKGFGVLDSTYKQMYLNQQCCRVVPPAGPGEKYGMCFWRDSGEGMTGSFAPLMEGGEVAMWSDNYCGAPHCRINGTYGWMYEPEQDDVFMESFGNSVFPGAAAAAGSLWKYDAALTPKSLPSTDFVNSINAHVDRLRARGVPSCANGCSCDWGSACLGDTTKFYGGRDTPYNVRVKLTNTGCDFNVHIKQKKVCNTKTGHDLASLKKGDSYTVVGQDFILSGIDGTTEKDGDQFSVWVGDGTWMNVDLDLKVTCDDTDYINMAP